VRHAYETLTGNPTRLIAFSDDMDGFRKVPTNVPNQDMLAEHLHKPLTQVPDPFGKFESFAAHNNAMLRDFLDQQLAPWRDALPASAIAALRAGTLRLPKETP